MERMIGDEWDDDDDRKLIIGSPSKTVIKFKIPIMSNKVEEEKRVCLECKKEFSSGKALGGHMRVHGNKNPNFHKPSKANKFKKTSYLKPYYMKSVNDEGKPTCSQCGKTFPSMKSLFGHMRCHPERVWRGILPPPSTGDGGGDQVVDLTKFLRRWPVTERRGRKSLKPADVDNDDVVLLEAVEDLLTLAHAGDSMAESGVTSKDNNKVDENSPSIKAVMVEEMEGKLGLDDHDGEINMRNSVNSSQKVKRRKKMKLMMDLDQNDVVVVSNGVTEQQEVVNIVTEWKYKCTTCNKGFATHQALGGHRSSHIKYSRFTPTDDDDHESFVIMKEFEFAVGGGNINGNGNGNGNSNSNSRSVVHQCKICDKVFATGQALGGHKRCHWAGISDAQGPSSQITSTGEAASETGKVFEFDLNEIPVMMMEEDDTAGNVNGYASSSYNSNMG